MTYPHAVRLVEVGPRDGLQNETDFIATDLKLTLIARLADCGFTTIEATSFVSPKWVPQMADHAEIMQRLVRQSHVRYPVLVPNQQGFDHALIAGATEFAVFTAASETFTQRNIHCSIAESLARFYPIVCQAKAKKHWVRGYISCVLGCPFEGEIAPAQVTAVARELLLMGCDEISLGDTIGVGTPRKVQQLIEIVSKQIPLVQLAIHFHDTYGQAIANIFAALQKGVRIIDSSIAGLGGCPYAPGASGNVATEDVLYLLEQLNITTNINLEKTMETSLWFCEQLGQLPRAKTTLAWHAKRGNK